MTRTFSVQISTTLTPLSQLLTQNGYTIDAELRNFFAGDNTIAQVVCRSANIRFADSADITNLNTLALTVGYPVERATPKIFFDAKDLLNLRFACDSPATTAELDIVVEKI